MTAAGTLLLAGCGTDPGAEPLPDPPPEDAPEHVKESWKEAFRSEAERLEAQDPRPDMKRVLDELALPGGLVFVNEKDGPPYCFAGSCPYVFRHYVSRQDLASGCRALEREVEANWSFPTTDFNVWNNTESCSGTARQGAFYINVTALPISDFELHMIEADTELPPAQKVPWVTGVVLEIVRPEGSPADES